MLFALLYPPDGVVGSVPQSVIDDQEEFIRNVHTTSSDLVSKHTTLTQQLAMLE